MVHNLIICITNNNSYHIQTKHTVLPLFFPRKLILKVAKMILLTIKNILLTINIKRENYFFIVWHFIVISSFVFNWNFLQILLQTTFFKFMAHPYCLQDCIKQHFMNYNIVNNAIKITSHAKKKLR